MAYRVSNSYLSRRRLGQSVHEYENTAPLGNFCCCCFFKEEKTKQKTNKQKTKDKTKTKKQKTKKQKQKREKITATQNIVDAEMKILPPKNRIKAIKGGLFSLTQSINIFIAKRVK